jgi:cobalt/nickel transport system permease protein
MGVLGAFLFAAQMINFSIPGTGSSGHLTGGILLAVLLGPHAAFLTVASVLMVQALFFADGGLLALGCNLFNLGVIPCLLVFPWLFKPLTGPCPARGRLNAAIAAAAIVSLQLGALAVVLETQLSTIATLPFSSFLIAMQSIHLAIGVVEAVATVAVVAFVAKARPGIVRAGLEENAAASASLRTVSLGFFAAALFALGILTQYASKAPDGLEWAVAMVTGKTELPAPNRGPHRTMGAIQEKSAILSGYRLSKDAAEPGPNSRNQAHPGTGVAGAVGASLTLIVSLACAFFLKRSAKKGINVPANDKVTPAVNAEAKWPR